MCHLPLWVPFPPELILGDGNATVQYCIVACLGLKPLCHFGWEVWAFVIPCVLHVPAFVGSCNLFCILYSVLLSGFFDLSMPFPVEEHALTFFNGIPVSALHNSHNDLQGFYLFLSIFEFRAVLLF